jgi:hypothetical protein
MESPLSPKQVHCLLHELSVELGCCFPAQEHERLQSRPPSDIDSFTDAVMIAEGLKPGREKKRVRRMVRELVAEHFDRAIKANHM